jgi:bacterioferritin-associated ferredoxin
MDRVDIGVRRGLVSQLKSVIIFTIGRREFSSMILCLCEAVNDRAVREAVRNGASTVGAIAKLTKAGTNCGSCACDLAQVIKSERKQSASESCCARPEQDMAALAAK